MSQRRRLQTLDDWISVCAWIWDRAYAFLLSGVGGLVMGRLAFVTDWIAKGGPIAWGGVGLASFILIYAVLVTGRHILAGARMRRAAAALAERTAEHASVNPLLPGYRDQRIRLTDLYTPFGEPLRDRTFHNCDLIGPAVVWVSPTTVFRGNSGENNEFIRINAFTARPWPNKLAIAGGVIEGCRIYNVILLVHDQQAASFENMVPGVIWMNDALPSSDADQKLLSPQGTGEETQQ